MICQNFTTQGHMILPPKDSKFYHPSSRDLAPKLPWFYHPKLHDFTTPGSKFYHPRTQNFTTQGHMILPANPSWDPVCTSSHHDYKNTLCNLHRPLIGISKIERIWNHRRRQWIAKESELIYYFTMNNCTSQDHNRGHTFLWLLAPELQRDLPRRVIPPVLWPSLPMFLVAATCLIVPAIFIFFHTQR